jgi:hypothetical protein
MQADLAISLIRYLRLAESYSEVLASSPLVKTREKYEIQAPSFSQFLDERGYAALADEVRKFEPKLKVRRGRSRVSRSIGLAKKHKP